MLRLLGRLWRGFVKAVLTGCAFVWVLVCASIGVGLVRDGWYRVHVLHATEFGQFVGYAALAIGGAIILLLMIDLLNLLPTSKGDLHGSSRLASWRSVRRRGIGKGY
jgi:TRAP-type C4-dicarboxylate transport system permease small subunit